MNFANREEVAKFQENLDNYVISRIQTLFSHYSLVVAYDICHIRWNPKIFSALVDLRINSMFVICDLAEINSLWSNIDKIKQNRQSEDDCNVFVDRMKIHHLLSGVTMRYRALWDKLFEFLLMFPFKSNRSKEENEKIIFESGISEGKKKLKKLLHSTPMSHENIILIYNHLNRFDALYRTPEAHSAGGSMSKWTLSNSKMDETPFEEFFLGAWNLWNHVENMLGDMFSEKALSLIQQDVNMNKNSTEK